MQIIATNIYISIFFLCFFIFYLLFLNRIRELLRIIYWKWIFLEERTIQNRNIQRIKFKIDIGIYLHSNTILILFYDRIRSNVRIKKKIKILFIDQKQEIVRLSTYWILRCIEVRCTSVSMTCVITIESFYAITIILCISFIFTFTMKFRKFIKRAINKS